MDPDELRAIDPEGHYRYCIYCGVDCYVEDIEHGPACPATTGLYPVRDTDIGACENCGHPTRPFFCCECKQPLKVGDHYVIRSMDSGAVEARPDAGWIVCVGCGVFDRDPDEVIEDD